MRNLRLRKRADYFGWEDLFTEDNESFVKELGDGYDAFIQTDFQGGMPYEYNKHQDNAEWIFWVTTPNREWLAEPEYLGSMTFEDACLAADFMIEGYEGAIAEDKMRFAGKRHKCAYTDEQMKILRDYYFDHVGMDSIVPQFYDFEKQQNGDYTAQDEMFEYEIGFNKFTDEWSAAVYDKDTNECVYETWDANFTPQDAWHEMCIGFVSPRVSFVAESSSEYDSMILSYVYEGDELSRFTSYIVVVGTTDFEEAKRAVESFMGW